MKETSLVEDIFNAIEQFEVIKGEQKFGKNQIYQKKGKFNISNRFGNFFSLFNFRYQKFLVH